MSPRTDGHYNPIRIKSRQKRQKQAAPDAGFVSDLTDMLPNENQVPLNTRNVETSFVGQLSFPSFGYENMKTFLCPLNVEIVFAFLRI